MAKHTTGLFFVFLTISPAVYAEEPREVPGMSVIGNSELPKELVIVPWKGSQVGDLAGRPVESLLDEVLKPIDREEFGREVNFYHAREGQ